MIKPGAGTKQTGSPFSSLALLPTPHTPDRATFVKLKSDQGPSLSESAGARPAARMQLLYLAGQGSVLLKKVGVSLEVRTAEMILLCSFAA